MMVLPTAHHSCFHILCCLYSQKIIKESSDFCLLNWNAQNGVSCLWLCGRKTQEAYDTLYFIGGGMRIREIGSTLVCSNDACDLCLEKLKYHLMVPPTLHRKMNRTTIQLLRWCLQSWEYIPDNPCFLLFCDFFSSFAHGRIVPLVLTPRCFMLLMLAL